MRLCNKLFVCAKCTQTESDWSLYRHMRNEVNNLMKEAYVIIANNYSRIPTLAMVKDFGHHITSILQS